MDNSASNPTRVRIYTISEAAKFVGVSATTVRRWLFGYAEAEPVLSYPNDAATPLVSFLHLAELAVAKAFRGKKLNLDRIRAAHDFAAEDFGIEFPFAYLKLEARGGHIIHQFEELNPGASMVALDTKGQQWTLGLAVRETLNEFDYGKENLAERWFPFGRDVPIVLDPTVCAGMPAVLDDRIAVSTILKRFKAGMHIDDIADDLVLETTTIENALRIELGDGLAA